MSVRVCPDSYRVVFEFLFFFFDGFVRLHRDSKRCRLLSEVIPKLFVQSDIVSSLQGANRVADENNRKRDSRHTAASPMNGSIVIL